MTVSLLWLFLTVPWVGLQCVIVVLHVPDHTHLHLYEQVKVYVQLSLEGNRDGHKPGSEVFSKCKWFMSDGQHLPEKVF